MTDWNALGKISDAYARMAWEAEDRRTWRREPPTVSGFYLVVIHYGGDRTGERSVKAAEVGVTPYGSGLCYVAGWEEPGYTSDVCFRAWLGPIPVPEPPTEEGR